MDTRLIKIENGEAHINFTIAPKAMKLALEQAYLVNKDKYKVDNIDTKDLSQELIEKTHGENVFLQDALDIIMPKLYQEAINKLGITVIADPDIEVGHVIKNKPVEVNIKVPVLPEFSLGSLEDLSIKIAKPTEVTEKAVNKYLEGLQQKHKIVIDKHEEPIAMGDTLTISYQYSIKGTAMEEKQDNFKITLGTELFPAEVENKLIGAKKGDVVRAEVSFPKNHSVTQLAGKKSIFKIKIKKVENIKIRELNDQFAKDIADLESLTELRLDCTEKVRQMAEQRDDAAKKQAVMNALLKRCSFELAAAVIMPMAQTLLQQFQERLANEGGNIDLYLQMSNSTMDKLKKEIWDAASNITKSNYIIEKLLQEADYTVTDAELDQYLERFAISNGMELSTAKANVGPLLDNMRFDIKAGKAIQAVLDKARVTVA